MSVVRLSALGLLIASLYAACDKEKDGAPADDTDETDTTDTEDDTGSGQLEGWTEIEFEAVDVDVPPTFFADNGMRWWDDPAAFSAQTTLTAPPEFTGDRQLVARISRPSAFPGSFGVIDGAYRNDDGSRLRTDVTWTEPDTDCVTFDVHIVATAFAVVEPFPRKPRPGLGREYNAYGSCAGGAAISETCTQDTPCAPGLLCHGLTRGDEGVCRPETLHVAVEHQGGEIPDGTGSLDVDVEVVGLPGTDEDVILELVLNHPRPEDLVVTLVNPGAREVTVLNHVPLAANTALYTAVTGFSGSDDASGTWTLRVADTVPGSSGSVSPSRLEVASSP
jgi:hypothetical protein